MRFIGPWINLGLCIIYNTRARGLSVERFCIDAPFFIICDSIIAASCTLTFVGFYLEFASELRIFCRNGARCGVDAGIFKGLPNEYSQPHLQMSSGKTTEWITKTTTHVRRFRRRGESRRISAATSYDEGAIQNGHVLFWITWTHLQCPARSINSLSRYLWSHLEESREVDAREAESNRIQSFGAGRNKLISDDKDLHG